MEFIEELLEQIDRRIAELGQELTGLLSARAALLRAPVTVRASGRPGQLGAVSEADVFGVLLVYPDGLSTPNLAKTLRVAPAEASRALAGMQAAGVVQRVGERRTARWRLLLTPPAGS